MKTPEEIKMGLECCFGDDEKRHCQECPYAEREMTEFPYVRCEDFDKVSVEAFAYIKRLEAERDALLAALRRVDIDCDCCKHSIDNAEFCEECDFDCGKCRNKENCRCEGCGCDNCNWEWCGIKEGAK